MVVIPTKLNTLIDRLASDWHLACHSSVTNDVMVEMVVLMFHHRIGGTVSKLDAVVSIGLPQCLNHFGPSQVAIVVIIINRLNPVWSVVWLLLLLWSVVLFFVVVAPVGWWPVVVAFLWRIRCRRAETSVLLKLDLLSSVVIVWVVVLLVFVVLIIRRRIVVLLLRLFLTTKESASVGSQVKVDQGLGHYAAVLVGRGLERDERVDVHGTGGQAVAILLVCRVVRVDGPAGAHGILLVAAVAGTLLWQPERYAQSRLEQLRQTGGAAIDQVSQIAKDPLQRRGNF